MPKKKAHKPSQSQLSHKSISFRTKLLLIVGTVLIFVPTIFYINQTIQLRFVVPEVAPVKQEKSISKRPIVYPMRISIAPVKIDLPIQQTKIVNGTWEISETGASHLAISANPGQPGPIILYAHNTNERFGHIRKIKQGDRIMLVTTDLKEHTYVVKETRTVAPTELSVFFSRPGEQLYLYTCTGFADLKRFVVRAEPER
jgi:LPXTG-site transpeptidase (sortase) family protein